MPRFDRHTRLLVLVAYLLSALLPVLAPPSAAQAAFLRFADRHWTFDESSGAPGRLADRFQT